MVEGNKPTTPPENDFMPLGKSWKGGFAPFPIECHPEERQQRGIPINGGGLCPPPTPPEINFLPFGVSWEGVPPSHYVTPS